MVRRACDYINTSSPRKIRTEVYALYELLCMIEEEARWYKRREGCLACESVRCEHLLAFMERNEAAHQELILSKARCKVRLPSTVEVHVKFHSHQQRV